MNLAKFTSSIQGSGKRSTCSMDDSCNKDGDHSWTYVPIQWRVSDRGYHMATKICLSMPLLHVRMTVLCMHVQYTALRSRLPDNVMESVQCYHIMCRLWSGLKTKCALSQRFPF